jgi:streptogramin lyase
VDDSLADKADKAYWTLVLAPRNPSSTPIDRRIIVPRKTEREALEDPGGVGEILGAVPTVGTNIWLTNFATNTVARVDPVTGTSVTYPVGTNSEGVTFDGANIWVTGSTAINVTKLIP